ncbi:MAG: hypothetical protein CME43_16065 [Haliea sp.]|nr:hypothetical protein [Haliea sp.]
MVNTLLREIELRLDALFAQLAEGFDAPPAQRLRLEGLLEAAALLGIATQAELEAVLTERYCAAFSCSPAEDFGAQWQRLFPFPQIPAMQRRAPVVPSTSDDL